MNCQGKNPYGLEDEADCESEATATVSLVMISGEGFEHLPADSHAHVTDWHLCDEHAQSWVVAAIRTRTKDPAAQASVASLTVAWD